MTSRRIVSIILFILGVSFYLIGNYISGEVAMGQKKISKAQKGVDTGRSLTDSNPYTKDVGGIVADSVQGKIDEGKKQASDYQTLADWLHRGGIVFVLVGAALFAYSFAGQKRG